MNGLWSRKMLSVTLIVVTLLAAGCTGFTTPKQTPKQTSGQTSGQTPGQAPATGSMPGGMDPNAMKGMSPEQLRKLAEDLKKATGK